MKPTTRVVVPGGSNWRRFKEQVGLLVEEDLFPQYLSLADVDHGRRSSRHLGPSCSVVWYLRPGSGPSTRSTAVGHSRFQPSSGCWTNRSEVAETITWFPPRRSIEPFADCTVSCSWCSVGPSSHRISIVPVNDTCGRRVPGPVEGTFHRADRRRGDGRGQQAGHQAGDQDSHLLPVTR